MTIQTFRNDSSPMTSSLEPPYKRLSHRISTASLTPSFQQLLMSLGSSSPLSEGKSATLDRTSRRQKRLSAVTSLKKEMLSSFSSASLNRHSFCLSTSPTTKIADDSNQNAATTSPSNTTIKKSTKQPKSKQGNYAEQRWKKVCGSANDPHVQGTIGQSSRTAFEQALYSKILQRRLPVNRYLKPASANKTSKLLKRASRMSLRDVNVSNVDLPVTEIASPFGCKRCQHPLETIEHFLFECALASQLWLAVRDLAMDILQLSPQEFPTISLRDVVLFFPELVPRLCTEEIHVLSVLHATALWILWTSRNYAFKYANLYTMFMSRLKARIVTEYHQQVPDWATAISSYAIERQMPFISNSFSDAESLYAFSCPSSRASIAGTRDSWLDHSVTRPLSGISLLSNETLSFSAGGTPPRKRQVSTLSHPPSCSVPIQTFETRWCAGSSIRLSPLGPIFSMEGRLSQQHISCQ